MRKIVRLTERDLSRLVKRIIKEADMDFDREEEDYDDDDEYYKDDNSMSVNDVVDKWENRTDDSFFGEFIEAYPSGRDFYMAVAEVLMDEQFPGLPEEHFADFIKDLIKAGY